MLGLIIIIIIVYYIFRSPYFKDLKGGRQGAAGSSARALDILDERYARGEISREEYLERKQELTRQAGGR